MVEMTARPDPAPAPAPDPAPAPAPDPAPAIELLQAVADPVRWTVLGVLRAGPRCVCDLQEHVDVPGNLLSYHLRVLREAGLVTASRRGRWIDYALAADAAERLVLALPVPPGAAEPSGTRASHGVPASASITAGTPGGP